VRKLACPQCGAPAHVAPGQSRYQCQYCQTTFDTGEAPAPPPPQPFDIPQIVIVPPAMEPVRVRTSSGPGCGILIGVLAPLFVGGLIAFSTLRQTGGLPGPLGPSWDGHTPLLCGGNESFDVKSVQANLGEGPLITAGGNCHVKCTDCKLHAKTGIVAGGNAEITIVNGSLEGSISAGGNARVSVIGNATFSGSVSSGGNAQVSVPSTASSGASVATGAPSPAPSPKPIKPHTPH
jgi:hypothetical protein